MSTNILHDLLLSVNESSPQKPRPDFMPSAHNVGKRAKTVGLYGFLCRGEVARPSWPCFFTDWKSVPPLDTKFLTVPNC